MDRARWRVGLVAAAMLAAGCGKDRPIRPFGSVHTNDFTVVPGPKGHPRGQMVPQQAPGIDLVRRPIAPDPAAAFDASARQVGSGMGAAPLP
jgi:hypothetical protein